MKYIRLFILTAAAGILLLVAFQKAEDVQQQPRTESKINGVSFVAPVRPVGVEAMRPIKKINASWVAITPYAFARAGSPELQFNLPRQWWGEREEGVIATIKHAKELGLSVMIKPHVWVRGQGWAGDFDLETEEEWQQWQSNYRDYILSYAKVADSLNVELLCIGTEYRKATIQRPDFWRGLIKDVRTIYAGKLTYAANWDNYDNIPFWDALDYIGIDAYFPLSEQETPSVQHLKEQWKPIKKELSKFADEQDNSLLFTEFGYQSVDFTADGHWKYEEDERALNLKAQVNAYRAIFETFWDEPWFGGGFLWKWYDRHPERGGSENKRYTPQNKPAEETIRQWFGRDWSDE